MVIQHNIVSIGAQKSMRLNTSAVEKHSKRLATGYRINSAADDAAGLAVSEKMRSQIRGLDQADRNALDGISLIQTAEGALNEVEHMIQRMRVLAIQGANDTNQTDDRKAINLEVQQLKAEIDRVATSTEYNKMILLDGRYSTQPYMKELDGDFRVIGDELADIGVEGSSFPPVVNPPTDGLWDVIEDSTSDSLTIYKPDTAGNYRVEYVNAGIRYTATLNEADVSAYSTLKLTQVTNVTTSPPNSLTLDVSSAISASALDLLNGDNAYDYITAPITTHAVTADLRPNTAPNAKAQSTLYDGSYVGAGSNYGPYNDGLDFTASIDFGDDNHNDNMGIKIDKGSESWTVTAAASEENIPFSTTGVTNMRNTAGWTDTYPSTDIYGRVITVTNTYTPSSSPDFYVSKVNGSLQYRMTAYMNRTYTESPGNSYNYGTYSYSMTGVRSGDTVNFSYNGHLLYSFDLSDGGGEFLSKLTDNPNFDVGAYCFTGASATGGGQMSGGRTENASYPRWGSTAANISKLTFDETIVFGGIAPVNFTIEDDGTIHASITLNTEGNDSEDNFTAVIPPSEISSQYHVTMKNSAGQTIDFDIDDLKSLREQLTWRDMTGSADDATPKYTVSFSNPPNSVSVTRQSDGSFYFELRKPNNGDVIMNGTCDGKAGTVTLDDSAYGKHGDKLTLNFPLFSADNPDTLDNYLKTATDTYSFTLYIDTIAETAAPQGGLSSKRADLTYPSTDIYGVAVDNPINNLTITCGADTTDLAAPNPPVINIYKSGSYYYVSVDTGEYSTYSSSNYTTLPDTVTTTYGGKSITVSGLLGMEQFIPTHGDSLSGTLEWYNLKQPHIEGSGEITAGHYPKTVEIPMGNPLWIQTGANRYQGLDVEIRCAKIDFLGHPIPISQISMLDRESCNSALGILDTALDDLSVIRADLGSYQNRLEYSLGIIKSTDENLTASESRIRDTDMALEFSEQAQNNVLTQANISVLAQANMSPQKILQLLR